MTREAFYGELKRKFELVLRENNILDGDVTVRCRSLSPEEAIGTPARRDYPILTGKDIMIEAEFRGHRGQAFTEAPREMSGSLNEILNSDILNDLHARGVYIAVLNAIMGSLGKCCGTVHCRTEGPELCAGDMLAWLRENYGDKKKIALIGYQPSLTAMLAESEYELRVLDLSPNNVGKVKSGITIEDGIRDYESVVKDFADLILCTGSTVCNGTIVDYIGLKTETVFFGTTLSGTAALMGLRRACFADRYA